jgi:hypothetical protein
MKLTKPQAELLRDVANGGNAVDTYPPARKLVELGLCTREVVGLSDRLILTDTGRELLAKDAGENA